ncbi:MAG: sigma-70 family RNA polymerase sigma factor [Solirubrobacterales bacterium]
MRLLSDDRLARRATQGDQRAFEAIYRRYHQDLYRFCLAMIGNPQDAQDALQNTMVKVLRALPGEERQIKLKPWLYRIARNEAVETLRRRRDTTELEPDAVRASTEIPQAVEDRERLRVLFVDLEQLPDRQRAALVMRELAGLDFAQIGEAFGSSAGVARQTLYEARLSLRQMEEGREMRCEAVMRELSDADGRVTRRRGLHAHLRSCSSCRAFRDSIAKRRDELVAIAPLPAALSAGLLHGLLGGQTGAAGAVSAAGTAGATGAAGASSTGLAGAIGAGAGKAVATSAIVKSVATVAVVAAVGGAAADRSGVIDLPIPGAHDTSTKNAAEPQGSSTPGEDGATTAGDSTEQANREHAPGAQSKGTANSGPSEGAKGGPAGRGGPHRSSPGNSTGGGSRSHSGQGNSQAARERGKPAKAGQGKNHGQETSVTHKSPNADPSPGNGNQSHPKPKPPRPTARPPKAKSSPATPNLPEPNPNAGGTASKGSGKGKVEAPEP